MAYTQKMLMRYISIISLFGIILLLFIAQKDFFRSKPIQPIRNSASVLQALQNNVEIYIPPKNIVAKAAYVYDIATDTVLYEKNALTQLPLASLTKVPLTLLAEKYLAIQNGHISITKKSLLTEGNYGLVAGDTWKTKDLIDFMLMESSNDAATAVSEAIQKVSGTNTISLLNTLAQKIGLSQTFFMNETGLDVNSSFSGSYGSARDVGTLFTYAYKTAPNMFTATTRQTGYFTSASGLRYTAKNTNEALYTLPGLIFGKTGYTDLAGGNLAIVIETEPNHPYVIVVLGSTFYDRFSDLTALVEAIHATRVRL